MISLCVEESNVPQSVERLSSTRTSCSQGVNERLKQASGQAKLFNSREASTVILMLHWTLLSALICTVQLVRLLISVILVSGLWMSVAKSH